MSDPSHRTAWQWHAKAVAVSVLVALLCAGALALNGPMATYGQGTDIRQALWILLAVGVVSHAAIASALLSVLLRAMPPDFAPALAHAIAVVAAGGVVTFAIVFLS